VLHSVTAHDQVNKWDIAHPP